MAGPFYGDDDYEYDFARRRGRPSPHRHRSDRRADQFLNPNAHANGLYRTRSQGHAPAPNVYVFNDMVQDANQSNRSASRSPPTILPYPSSPRHRPRDLDLAQDMADLALENQRLRSRSRGRSDVGAWDGRGDFYESQLRNIERQRSMERERERIKQEYEIKALRDADRRRSDEQKDKDDRKRIIDDYERKQREESAERKAEEERIKLKIEKDKRDAAAEEKRQYDEFLAKQHREKEEKERKDKEAEEKFQDEMRRRLSQQGYSQRAIEEMIQKERPQPQQDTTRRITTTKQVTRWQNPNASPLYPKIHTKYISVDTLRYYDLPWHYDEKDSSYIIIRREMDQYETDVLFEHTRKLREGKTTLLLEAPEKKYAFYRKRDRSSSRIRKVGILEMK